MPSAAQQTNINLKSAMRTDNFQDTASSPPVIGLTSPTSIEATSGKRKAGEDISNRTSRKKPTVQRTCTLSPLTAPSTPAQSAPFTPSPQQFWSDGSDEGTDSFLKQQLALLHSDQGCQEFASPNWKSIKRAKARKTEVERKKAAAETEKQAAVEEHAGSKAAAKAKEEVDAGDEDSEWDDVEWMNCLDDVIAGSKGDCQQKSQEKDVGEGEVRVEQRSADNIVKVETVVHAGLVKDNGVVGSQEQEASNGVLVVEQHTARELDVKKSSVHEDGDVDSEEEAEPPKEEPERFKRPSARAQPGFGTARRWHGYSPKERGPRGVPGKSGRESA